MATSSDSPEIPEQYLCPISLQIMTGPVFCLQNEEAASRTLLPRSTPVYEYQSISDWLKNGKHPELDSIADLEKLLLDSICSYMHCKHYQWSSDLGLEP